jgi:hypothetical protein
MKRKEHLRAKSILDNKILERMRNVDCSVGCERRERLT